MVFSQHVWIITFMILYLQEINYVHGDDRLGRLRENMKQFPNKCGFVDVREGAHTFWWLYYSTHEDGYSNRPLIIWLQGGPGASGTQYGNFHILGALDEEFNIRNFSWVQEANILFVDNPVGAGFSYVDDVKFLTTNVTQIALDLLTFYSVFLEENPEFSVTPLYIFGQSYGGKMATMFSKYLYESIQLGEIITNFKGYAMGNSWISPEDATLTWGPLLLWMSLVDQVGYEAIQKAAQETKHAIHNGEWEKATQCWSNTQQEVFKATEEVDFYNIMNFEHQPHSDEMRRDLYAQERGTPTRRHPIIKLPGENKKEKYMNEEVKVYLEESFHFPLGINWTDNVWQVFNAHAGDFMKPVVDTVAELLEYTDLRVVVYQGQLDLICDTKGALDWVQKMNWSKLGEFNNSTRYHLHNPEETEIEGYVKSYDNFSFYWIFNAGHSTPAVGYPALRMLKRIIYNEAEQQEF